MEIDERSKIQRLYDACDTIFSGKRGLPTLRQIKWLQDLLDLMEPMDVGIDGSGDNVLDIGVDGSKDERRGVDEARTRSLRGFILGHAVKKITYIHIYECDEFSMGVFCFPAGGRLPLHNHPGMVVLSKVLYGSVSMKAYDWVTTPNSRPKYSGLARVVADDRILQAPCKASVLFPTSGGNIHSFTALTSCAILDVLTPPYSDELGRPSTYFSEIPIPSLPGCALLEERDLPEDLEVDGAPYLGPELIVDDVDFY